MTCRARGKHPLGRRFCGLGAGERNGPDDEPRQRNESGDRSGYREQRSHRKRVHCCTASVTDRLLLAGFG